MNNGKCRCECKEFIYKDKHDEGFIWNPSTYECECDKSCDLENIQIMQTVSLEKG